MGIIKMNIITQPKDMDETVLHKLKLAMRDKIDKTFIDDLIKAQEVYEAANENENEYENICMENICEPSENISVTTLFALVSAYFSKQDCLADGTFMDDGQERRVCEPEFATHLATSLEK